MTQQAEIDTLVSEALRFGRSRLDILVNNAGGLVRRAQLGDLSEALIEEVLRLNFTSVVLMCRAVIPHMVSQGGGRVINISSLHELTPTGFSALYGMSKGGMAMMMREMAKSYSRFGITINDVCPGATRTDINREVLSDPEYEAKVIAKIPAGFIAEPEDIAPTVTFLASDAARYVTGASIFIDGGLWL